MAEAAEVTVRERIEFAVLRWIFSRWFVQSHVHKRNVRRAYGLIRLILLEEFHEESSATLKPFCDECYESVWSVEAIRAWNQRAERKED